MGVEPSDHRHQRRFAVVTDPTIKGRVRKVSAGICAMPAAFIVICAERAPDAREWNEWTYLAECAIAAQNMDYVAASRHMNPYR